MRTVYTAYTLSECMDVMTEYVRAREKEGKRTIVFCEDRLTLIAERALAFSCGGTFFTSVSTFARFLQTEKRVLSKQGSVMAVGTVMARLQKENQLRLFRYPEGIKAAAKSIYETIAQLSASEVDGEALESVSENIEEGIFKNKLHDLALVYESYAEFLKERGYLDESGYLSLLPQKIKGAEELDGASAVFLCYGSFTKQIAAAIRACMERADEVVGIFCGGEEEIYTNRAAQTFIKAGQEFGKIEKIDRGIELPKEAGVLRRVLFDPQTLASYTKTPYPTENVRVFECQEKLAETELVAAQIKKLMTENSDMRYRDIAVLLSDPQGYALSIKKTFREFQIPCFMDVKKSLRLHPLSKFLLGLFAIVRERFSPSSVQTVLANPFFGECDDYRNYLLKYAAYRGGAKREIKTGAQVSDYNEEELRQNREKLLSATEKIPTKGNGGRFAAAVREILKAFACEKTLDALITQAEDAVNASYLSQITAALDKTLDEITLLTADREMTISEFEAIFSGGLDATEISVIPLKSDAVFVGDITDSRIEKARAVFAVGMTDVVPRNADDTALISDREIERLEEIKMQIEPTVYEVNLRSRESMALNLCAFTEKLYLSYSLSADGEAPALSEVLRYLSAFVKTDGTPIATEKGLSEEDFAYGASAVVPAVRRLILEKAAFEQGDASDTVKYSSLYAALDKTGEENHEDYVKGASSIVRIKEGERLFFGNGKISPTVLEGYFSCPFSNFAERGLKLKEREENLSRAIDSGNFIHELLKETGERARDFSTEEEARKFAITRGRELLQKPEYSAQSDTASGEYAQERLLTEGVEAAVAVYRQIVGSLFTVEKAESEVKSEYFYGKVDRVDVSEEKDGKSYVRVVDYKTGKITDDASAYYTGRKVQRQLYMSAVMGNRIPAGVFYFPASLSYKERGADEKNFKMSGYINGEKEAVQAGDIYLQEDECSEFFKARLSDFSRLENAMDEDTFRDFIAYATEEAKVGAKEMREGFIAPSPYEGACDYCKYGGACGFHKDVCATRKEGTLKPTEIAEIARGARGYESYLTDTAEEPIKEKDERGEAKENA